jgi:hypothetical protein
MNLEWPPQWSRLIQGIGCEMCESNRPDEDRYGIRIYKTETRMLSFSVPTYSVGTHW